MSEADRITEVYRNRDVRDAMRWDLNNRGNQQILEERRAMARRLLGARGWLPLANRSVLDVGCGGGYELAWFRELGAQPSALTGIDLLPERIEIAHRHFPDLNFKEANAEVLPFGDASFELIVASTLFSSILDPATASKVAAEIVRVMRPGGGLLWYDLRYDSPSNRNVRGLRAGRVKSLFPSLTGRLQSLTVVPPLARRLGRLTSVAYPVLASMPPMRSHLMGLLLKAE